MLFISLSEHTLQVHYKHNDNYHLRVEVYIDMDITVSNFRIVYTIYKIRIKTPSHANLSIQARRCACAVYQKTHRPRVFSGSICTSFPLISLTDVNAGLPAYNCCGACVEFCPPPPSISRDTEMGALPRKRLRMSTRPRLYNPKYQL